MELLRKREYRRVFSEEGMKGGLLKEKARLVGEGEKGKSETLAPLRSFNGTTCFYYKSIQSINLGDL